MFLALLKESIGTLETALRIRVANTFLFLRDSWWETELLIISTIMQTDKLRCHTGSVFYLLLLTMVGKLPIVLS
jgi:hypothetical protein